MAYDYTSSRATAERLIAKFGVAATLIRTTSSGDAWSPTLTDVDHDCTIVAMKYDQSAIDGTMIRQTDRRMYVSTAGLTITPAENDRITVSGLTYNIVTVSPLQPGSTALLWDVQARA